MWLVRLLLRHFERGTTVDKKDNDGRCVCGHKMHKIEHPHACWGGPDGKCTCRQFIGIVDGKPLDPGYVRGGSRTRSRPFRSTIEG